MSRNYRIVSALQCAVSSCFSFSMSCGSIPVAVSPCFGGYPLGFYKYLGMGAVKQLALSIALLGYFAGFSMILFYQRFIALRLDDNKCKSKLIVYPCFFFWILICFIVNTVVNVFLRIDNIPLVKKKCLEIYNGDPNDITREDTVIASFFESGIYFTIHLCCLLSFVIVYMILILISGILTYYALLELKTKMSERTLKKHSHLIKVLYTQTVFHFVGFSIPAAVFLLTPMLEIGIPEMVNVAMVVLVVTNILSPAYVFFNIASYKKAIIQLFRIPSKSARSAVFSI